MHNRLTYEEIIGYSFSCGISTGSEYIYKDIVYQVSDIVLVAGVDEIKFEVIYYPVNKIIVRFARELEDFKSKFKKV